MSVALTSNNKTHGTLRVPWVTLGISGLAVILYLVGGSVFELFLIDKTAVAQGEWWRILLGHFVHYNFDHLFWDVVALGILGAIIEYNNPKDLLPAFVISCLGVSGWFLLSPSHWSAYCGLSGALNGLLVVAAIRLWQTTKNNTFLLAILLTVGKTVYEIITKQTIFTDMNAQAVPEAHVAGLASGFVYLGLLIITKKWLSSMREDYYNNSN